MLLEVKDLKVSYGNIEALHGISFNVDKGEIVTLIGANGAGKTSTLMSLARLGRPEAPVVKSGDILFEGSPLGELSPREQAARIGFVLQSPDNQIVTDKVWHELAFGPEKAARFFLKETASLKQNRTRSFRKK